MFKKTDFIALVKVVGSPKEAKSSRMHFVLGLEADF